MVMAGFVVAVSADYEVQKGDTLSSIAALYGVKTSELITANGITNPDLIRIGQILIIPGQTSAGAGAHVVAAGDTLAAIAARYGTTVNAIASANNLSDPNLIRPGQQLVIPGASDPSATAAASAAPVAEGQTHTVSAGETLASIAAQYGTTVEALTSANGISDTSMIYVGTVLRLSGSGFVAEATTSPASVYTVVAGDSLATVAARYGITVDALVSANNLADPNLIRIGQELDVPTAMTSWVCPVPGASYFNDWGFPRSGGRFHEGNDLFAARGTSVLAPVAGTAIFQNGRIGGLQFRLYGDDGNTYIGTHMDAMGTDGYYEAGGQLGTVGDSGNALGGRPHLHFEIHPGDGAAANPFPTLSKFGC
jgi:LysM repeat protein